jgi:hypothetical protein
MDGEGEDGRGALTSLSPPDAFTNRRRFFVNRPRGVTPYRRGRYRRWRHIWWRHGGLGNDFFGGFGDTRAQSKETKRGSALRLYP